MTIVLIDNHGFSSVGRVSEQVGSEGFGCHFRARTGSGWYDGAPLEVDFPAICRGLGAHVTTAATRDELRARTRRCPCRLGGARRLRAHRLARARARLRVVLVGHGHRAGVDDAGRAAGAQGVRAGEGPPALPDGGGRPTRHGDAAVSDPSPAEPLGIGIVGCGNIAAAHAPAGMAGALAPGARGRRRRPERRRPGAGASTRRSRRGRRVRQWRRAARPSRRGDPRRLHTAGVPPRRPGRRRSCRQAHPLREAAGRHPRRRRRSGRGGRGERHAARRSCTTTSRSPRRSPRAR